MLHCFILWGLPIWIRIKTPLGDTDSYQKRGVVPVGWVSTISPIAPESVASLLHDLRNHLPLCSWGKRNHHGPGPCHAALPGPLRRIRLRWDSGCLRQHRRRLRWPFHLPGVTVEKVAQCPLTFPKFCAILRAWRKHPTSPPSWQTTPLRSVPKSAAVRQSAMLPPLAPRNGSPSGKQPVPRDSGDAGTSPTAIESPDPVE